MQQVIAYTNVCMVASCNICAQVQACLPVGDLYQHHICAQVQACLPVGDLYQHQVVLKISADL